MHTTKTGIIVRSDLQDWQKLNVTAFLATGIAAADPQIIGGPYEDGSGNEYLALTGEPIFIYSAPLEHLLRTNARARSRGIKAALYVESMFQTFNDIDNRAVVKNKLADELDIVGLAFRAERKTFDKIVHGLKLHS